MSIYNELLKDVMLPSLFKVRYSFPTIQVDDVDFAVRQALKRENTVDRISPGQKVAIATGSREIANIGRIIKILVNEITIRGGLPYLVPAMGSHGGATAEGQQAVLESFGLSEDVTGVPIHSSMETILIGHTNNMPVYFDKHASKADWIIPIGRIKPHTDFRGQFESGLIKMIAIGLGNQKGASLCHQLGLSQMSTNIQSISSLSLERLPFLFGLGIVENAFHETAKIVAIPPERIKNEEPDLLKLAKKLIPCIPFRKVDVIVVNEMGKDISGTGIDSNVVGRSSTLGVWEPHAERIVVLDLTKKSHYNANGVGLADVITKKLFDKISLEETYPNAITSTETNAVKIPVIMPTAELAVKCAIKTCTRIPPEGIRLVHIRNTLSMDEFSISSALVEEAKEKPDLTVFGKPDKMDLNLN